MLRETDVTVVIISGCIIMVAVMNGAAGCMCKISPTDVEQCGSNGEIYSNICFLHCARFLDKSIYAMSMDFCGRPTKFSCRRRCPKDYDPVCGSDGKTHRNDCHLRCGKRKHKKLHVVKIGKCSKLLKISRRKEILDPTT